MAVVAVVLAAGLAACGLPEDDRPRLVADADAPLDLVPTTAAPAVVPDDSMESADVYFMSLDQTRLQRRIRPVEEVSVETAVNALLELGLTEEEQGLLVNAIPQGVVLLDAQVEAGVATLDLGPAGEGGILSVEGPAQARAFAQLVFTATAVPDVTEVRFLIAGQPIDVQTDAGAVGDPVDRADYASLSPASG